MEPAIDLINPTIFVWGWEIREPITSLTDLLVAGCALFFYAQLGLRKPLHRVEKLMRGYFLFMGLGTGLSGILGHGLQAYLSWEWKALGWIISCVGVACYAMSAACLVQPRLPGRYYRLIINLVGVLLLGLLLALAWPPTRNFDVVRWYNMSCILGVVLPLHLYGWLQEKNHGSGWVLISMVVGIMVALVFSQQLNFGPWFNHNDISHVLMMVHTYILYLATQRFLPGEAVPLTATEQ